MSLHTQTVPKKTKAAYSFCSSSASCRCCCFLLAQLGELISSRPTPLATSLLSLLFMLHSEAKGAGAAGSGHFEDRATNWHLIKWRVSMNPISSTAVRECQRSRNALWTTKALALIYASNNCLQPSCAPSHVHVRASIHFRFPAS